MQKHSNEKEKKHLPSVDPVVYLKFSSRKNMCVYSSKHKTTSRHVFIVPPSGQIMWKANPVPLREFHQGPPMPPKMQKSKNDSIAIFGSILHFHGHFKAAFQSLHLIINHPDLLRSKADANSLAKLSKLADGQS
ncbi:hypothetical protein T10_7713 [Trichinella papuae]|uniref:Uncharacterized protein n=1 Tax=Trichinella papuae TaxID=268474 RepID=A0A0V1M651_9BILA|nr:hypothetical protein T10_7713 [Trichinella papuae]